MSINEDFTNKIKNIIPDELLVVRHSFPPKYLLPFVNENNIIFIYKQKEVEEESLEFKGKTPFSDETFEELELTGQPLECPFNIDDSIMSDKMLPQKQEEDNHYPLTLQDAREIVSFINLRHPVEVPLYILTDGFDRNRTIALGTSSKDGWFTRSWISLEDNSKDSKRITDVNEMIRNHQRSSHINPIHMKSEVCCKYVIEILSECHATFLQDSSGRLEMDLSWKTPTFTIPLNETSVKMTINSSISDENCEVFELWEQLTLLYDYVEMIKVWKKEISVQGPYSRQCIDFPNYKISEELQNKPIKDVLIQLLLEPNKVTGTTLTGRNADFEKKTLEEIVKSIVNEKKEQEFTDKLWSLLIGCSSYQEIRMCFELVFQYVRNGSSKPYMKTTNITRLSHVLRCCKKDSSHSEMILEPLELLVEIGIEKLKKEYISVYLLAKIASSEQLNIPPLPKFPEIKADDWIENCSKWITWLMRVHIVLQLMIVTENIMKSNVCIIPLTALTLENYLSEKSPIDTLMDPRTIKTQTFITPINTRDVQELFNGRTQFNSWTLTLKSAVANKEVVSIYHRNIDELFPASVTLANDLDADDNATYVSNVCSYHCYNFHSVSDLMF